MNELKVKKLIPILCLLACAPIACLDSSKSRSRQTDFAPLPPPPNNSLPQRAIDAPPRPLQSSPLNPDGTNPNMNPQTIPSIDNGLNNQTLGIPKANSDGTYSLVVKVPLNSFILQVRLIDQRSNITSISAKMKDVGGEAMTSHSQSERLRQININSLPKSNQEVVYWFFRPGDQVEITYKANSQMPFDIQALGVDSCEKLAMKSTTQSMIEVLKNLVPQKINYIQTISCLGNLKFVDAWKARVSASDIKNFLQDWFDLSVSSLEKGALDLTMRTINSLSLKRFMDLYIRNNLKLEDPIKVSNDSLRAQHSQMLAKISLRDRSLSSLLYLVRAQQDPGIYRFLDLLRKASEKDYTYKMLSDKVDIYARAINQFENFFKRLHLIESIISEENSTFQSRHLYDLYRELLTSISHPAVTPSAKGKLKLALDKISRQFQIFQADLRRIHESLSKADSHLIAVDQAHKNWIVFVDTINNFYKEISPLLASQPGLAKQEDLTDYLNFHKTLEPEVNSQIRSYLQEFPNPALTETVLESPVGISPLLNLNTSSQKSATESLDQSLTDLVSQDRIDASPENSPDQDLGEKDKRNINRTGRTTNTPDKDSTRAKTIKNTNTSDSRTPTTNVTEPIDPLEEAIFSEH